jgi:hypothetical protein
VHSGVLRFVLLYVFMFLVPCCDVCCDFCCNVCMPKMFSQSLTPVICTKAHVLYMLSVFVCIKLCPIRLYYRNNMAGVISGFCDGVSVDHVFFYFWLCCVCFFLWPVCPILIVSLDCRFWLIYVYCKPQTFTVGTVVVVIGW